MMNRGDGIKGYITVNSTTGAAKLIKMKKGILIFMISGYLFYKANAIVNKDRLFVIKTWVFIDTRVLVLYSEAIFEQ